MKEFFYIFGAMVALFVVYRILTTVVGIYSPIEKLGPLYFQKKMKQAGLFNIIPIACQNELAMATIQWAKTNGSDRRNVAIRARTVEYLDIFSELVVNWFLHKGHPPKPLSDNIFIGIFASQVDHILKKYLNIGIKAEAENTD